MAGEDEGLNDLVGSAVEAASADPTGAEEAGAEATTEAVAEPQATASPSDGWQPPTREEFEAIKQHADLGRRFAPYANDIDGLLRGGLRPQAHAAGQSAPTPDAHDGLDDVLGDKYPETLEALTKDGRMWDTIFRGLNKRVNGKQLDALNTLAERLDYIEAHVGDLRAWNEVINPRRFAEAPEWKKSGKEYLELQRGGLRDPDKAWEIASKRAAAMGATPATAAAAGNRAAAKVEAANAEVTKKAPAPTTAKRPPAPANDKAMSATGRKPTGVANTSPKRRTTSRDNADAAALVSAALDKFGVT